jgi:hypothetical protein
MSSTTTRTTRNGVLLAFAGLALAAFAAATIGAQTAEPNPCDPQIIRPT